MSWQPIESVPKDGTVVDLGGLDWEGKWIRWCDARWEPCYPGDPESWKGPWSDGHDSPIPSRFTPTHWMRPPAPPDAGIQEWTFVDIEWGKEGTPDEGTIALVHKHVIVVHPSTNPDENVRNLQAAYEAAAKHGT